MKRSGIKKILIIVAITIAVIGGYHLYNKFILKVDDTSNNVGEELDNNIEEDSNTPTKENEDEEETEIVIEIKGEVKCPGVYTFYKDNVTINDVIVMASGLTKRANTDDLNLTEYCKNHSVIVIGTIDSKSYVLGENEELLLLNINTATKEELMELPGIGEAKALQIIKYRIENGYFKSKEDICKVSGIGESVYSKIKDYITV